MPREKNECLDMYVDALAAESDGVNLSTAVAVAQFGLKSDIYGDLIARYLESASNVLSDGELESAVDPYPFEVARGISFLVRAACRTESVYATRHPEVFNTDGFRQAISDLQDNVAKGAIVLLPEEYAMYPDEGTSQVNYADARFRELGQRVQLLMAGLNYATFTGKTMLTGQTLLDTDVEPNLEGWTEKQLQESMPHLVLSNLAIGQIVSALLQKGKADDVISIIDTGSGTGCTLAGSVLGIQEAVEKGADPKKLSITGIEGGRKFFEDELVPFADTALDRVGGLGLELAEDDRSVESGRLNLVYGDILDTLKDLEFSKEVRDGVVVITANYVWHRLTIEVKDAIIQEVVAQAPNAIFLVSDLVQNASVVNRRYFNFRDNGLMNCGNIGLADLFDANGFKLVELNENTAPSSMDAALARRIGEGPTSDSIFYIAYRGDKAADMIETW